MGAVHRQEIPKPTTDSVSLPAYIIKQKIREILRYVAHMRKQISSLTTEARVLKQPSF